MLDKDYETINLERDGSILTLWLARPEVCNAFNDLLLAEVLDALIEIGKNKSVRVLVVTGRGKAFCAGADLNWMKKVVDYTFEENINDSRAIARMFYQLYNLKKPTICAVNGATIGGGMGFLGAADFVLASKDAVFGLSEVRLGLVPACIAPFLLRRAGAGKLKKFFLTGERFSPETAKELGLVDKITAPEELLTEAYNLARSLLEAAPGAQAVVKELLERAPELPLTDAMDYTVETIAKLRASDEAQRGMRSFLAKKPCKWNT